MLFSLLWVPVTLVAALAQTARNLTQRSLIEAIGVIGATQVRFLYGLPFSIAFLALICLFSGVLPPSTNASFLAFVTAGALSQIVATALMLAAMRERSFALTTTYTKTEPVQVALFGALVLGDALSSLKLAAVLIATAGVILMAWKPGEKLASAGLRPALLGISAGAFFALAAIGFRGAILSLPLEASFLMRAGTTLVWGLAIQSAVLLAYLAAFDRQALTASFKAWKPSLQAGFLGAFASQFWFIGFSLTSAANVRTLALIEVLFAQLISRKLFTERQSPRELFGMVLVVIGVALILLQAL
ncbi:MAG: DMT family transporter [Bosea sp. (in: a-proteobacteria)]